MDNRLLSGKTADGYGKSPAPQKKLFQRDARRPDEGQKRSKNNNKIGARTAKIGQSGAGQQSPKQASGLKTGQTRIDRLGAELEKNGDENNKNEIENHLMSLDARAVTGKKKNGDKKKEKADKIGSSPQKKKQKISQGGAA